MSRRVWVVECWHVNGDRWLANEVYGVRGWATDRAREIRCNERTFPPAYRCKWRVVPYVPERSESDGE